MTTANDWKNKKNNQLFETFCFRRQQLKDKTAVGRQQFELVSKDFKEQLSHRLPSLESVASVHHSHRRHFPLAFKVIQHHHHSVQLFAEFCTTPVPKLQSNSTFNHCLWYQSKSHLVRSSSTLKNLKKGTATTFHSLFSNTATSPRHSLKHQSHFLASLLFFSHLNDRIFQHGVFGTIAKLKHISMLLMARNVELKVFRHHSCRI